MEGQGHWGWMGQGHQDGLAKLTRGGPAKLTGGGQNGKGIWAGSSSWWSARPFPVPFPQMDPFLPLPIFGLIAV